MENDLEVMGADIGALMLYVSMPIVAALIGWFTNYLAVKMIFRPRRQVRVFGISFMGVIPRRQKELAAKIGETVEEELVSHEDVRSVVTSPKMQTEILRLIGEQVDIFLEETLGRIPMTRIVLFGKVPTLIRAKIIEQLLGGSVPGALNSMMKKVEGELDFQAIVREKIENLDTARLEGIVYRVAKKELKMIEVFGAVLGFLVGLIQVGVLILRDTGVL